LWLRFCDENTLRGSDHQIVQHLPTLLHRTNKVPSISLILRLSIQLRLSIILSTNALRSHHDISFFRRNPACDPSFPEKFPRRHVSFQTRGVSQGRQRTGGGTASSAIDQSSPHLTSDPKAWSRSDRSGPYLCNVCVCHSALSNRVLVALQRCFAVLVSGPGSQPGRAGDIEVPGPTRRSAGRASRSCAQSM
jgi:hypothetical protein